MPLLGLAGAESEVTVICGLSVTWRMLAISLSGAVTQ
jgi:hypothetical protein